MNVNPFGGFVLGIIAAIMIKMVWTWSFEFWLSQIKDKK